MLKRPALFILFLISFNLLWAQGIFTDGILPKLENAFSALHAGVKEVLIGQAGDLHKNTKEETDGTLIKL